MLGKRTDVKALLLESDIFVLPSRREGMPNALMEAMLLGLPCIATDISGCQDLIKHGESGLLVPPANVEKLADAITYLMNNPNEGKKMGTLARKTILELNTMEIVANQYLALYNNVANTENKP
jgi:glycosyltransferase involved in cell wall biosynthesis